MKEIGTSPLDRGHKDHFKAEVLMSFRRMVPFTLAENVRPRRHHLGFFVSSLASALISLTATARAQALPPPLSPGAPPVAASAAQQATSLLSQINDEGVRAKASLDAKDLPRAKDSRDRQDAASQKLTDLQAQTNADPALSAAAPIVNSAAAQANLTTTATANSVKTAAGQSGCDGSSKVCLFGGALVGSYSLTVGSGDRSGQTAHHIISLLVPSGGVRWAASSHISVDLGFYTAIISPEFQPNAISPMGSGCSMVASKFNDMLPCEGNTALRPYGAMLLGGTIGTGSSSLGIITIGYTVGVARTTQDANAFWFQGLMIGTAGVYSTVPL